MISFKLIKDGNTILKTPKNSNLLNTIYSVLGKDYHKNLIDINYLEDDLKIKGYISNNNLYRSNRNHQYLYINGRYISHLNISKIIEKEYTSIIPLNRLPVFVLNIYLNPNEVDINIHPTKQEVKFVNSEHIYNIIKQTIKEKLMPSINVPEMKLYNDKDNINKDIPILYNNINNFLDNKDSQDKKEVEYSNDTNIVIKDFTSNEYINGPTMESKNYFKDDNLNYKKNKKKNDVVEQKIEDILLDINPIGRVFNTYIIAESKFEEKIYFIDQHAAHERVMYEKYIKEYNEEKIVTQQLLYPEIIEFTSGEIDLINENKNLFEKLGFSLDAFGDSSIAIRGVPLIFGEPKIRNLFLDILDGLQEGIDNNYDTKIDKIMKISCTNAIKSGDKIGDLEIIALFESLKNCNNPYTCPHGRPTIIELTKKDIEKQFLRII